MTATRVCALLSWYDESPMWLSACVASLAGVVDHIAAVDGAYALFPEATARPSSPLQQQLAIVEAAAAIRVPLTMHIPGEPWFGNEVEKRNATIQIAQAAVAHDESWWLMVVDADMRVVADTGSYRHRLDRTDCDVARFGLRERIDIESDTRLAKAARLGTLQKETLLPVPWLYRSVASLEYVGTHYCIRNERGFIGGPPGLGLLPAADVSMDLEFEHHSKFRDLERKERALRYYDRRNEAHIEEVPSEVTCVV